MPNSPARAVSASAFDTPPTIGCLCVTYDRPAALARMIGCFDAQTYPQRTLMILDDAGQYDNQTGDRWCLASLPVRFATLGEKRNACAALLPAASLLSVWDDDDIYLPWHLETLVAALRDADWAVPREVLIRRAGDRLSRQPGGGLFHSGWGFRRTLFRRVGGYPAIGNGEDRGLAERFRRAGTRSTPYESLRGPSLLYSWFADAGAVHLSAAGGSATTRPMSAAPTIVRVGRVVPVPFEVTANGLALPAKLR